MMQIEVGKNRILWENIKRMYASLQGSEKPSPVRWLLSWGLIHFVYTHLYINFTHITREEKASAIFQSINRGYDGVRQMGNFAFDDLFENFFSLNFYIYLFLDTGKNSRVFLLKWEIVQTHRANVYFS